MNLSIYYIGSAEGHEYPDLQVGDEVNPRTLLCSLKPEQRGLCQHSPIFYTKYHMISNLIGTMTCLFYLDHLS